MPHSLRSRTGKTVGGITISRAFGYVRDLILASTIGAGAIMDVWAWAFPFFGALWRTLTDTPMEASATPVLSGATREDHQKGSGAILVGLVLRGIPILLLLSFLAPSLARLLAPGLDQDLATQAIRGLTGYLAGISVSSWAGAVLRSRGRMLAAALAPVSLNIALIVTLLVWGKDDPLGSLLWGMGWGAWLAATVQVVAFWKVGNRPILRFSHPLSTATFRRYPASMGVAAVESIPLMVGRALATLLGIGSVSWVYYAQRIFQLPQALLGIAVGQSALPALSGAWRRGDREEADKALKDAVRLALLMSIPVTLLLVGWGPETMSLVFERGKFTAEDSLGAGNLLRLWALAIPFVSIESVLTRGWYAFDLTKELLKVRTVQSVVGVAIVWLIFSLPTGIPPLWGIPLGGFGSTWVGVAWLSRHLPQGIQLHLPKQPLAIIFLGSIALLVLVAQTLSFEMTAVATVILTLLIWKKRD